LDIRSDAGQLLTPPYAKVGQMIYGDALDSLSRSANPSISSSTTATIPSTYEAREYETINESTVARRRHPGDNSHCLPVACQFSEDNGRRFLFFKEEPRNTGIQARASDFHIRADGWALRRQPSPSLFRRNRSSHARPSALARNAAAGHTVLNSASRATAKV